MICTLCEGSTHTHTHIRNQQMLSMSLAQATLIIATNQLNMIRKWPITRFFLVYMSCNGLIIREFRLDYTIRTGKRI